MIRSVSEAGRARRVDVGHLADGERAGPDDERAAGDHRDHDRQDHVDRARAQDHDDRQRQDDERQGQEDVHHALEDHVQPPAEVGAGDAQDGAQRRAEQRRDQPDGERGPRAVHQARVHVPPVSVGAEPVLGARRCQHGPVVGCERVVRGQLRRQHRDDRHQDDEAGPERAKRAPAHELARPVEPSGRRLGGGDVGEDADRRVDRHQRYRIRGSIQAKARSTRKLTAMNVPATSSTRAWVRV